MKKVITLALALLLLLCTVQIIPEARATGIVEQGTCGDSVNWALDDQGTLTISGTGAMYDYSGHIQGYEAPYYALADQIQSIVIADGVTYIGSCAFYQCEAAAQVTIPSSVTAAGSEAFANCSSLTEVTLPDSITTLSPFLFWGCSSLESIRLPITLTAIGEAAFMSCDGLTSPTLPDSVTSIGDLAFSYCDNLISLTIPASVTSLGQDLFANSGQLKQVTFLGNAPTFADSTFSTAYIVAEYPANNATWTSEVLQDYSGYITWLQASDCAHVPVSANNAQTPTCAEHGKEADTVCSVCGVTLKRGNPLYAPGHDYVGDICTVCGEVNIRAEGTCGDNLTWVLDTLGTLTISGTGTMYDYSDTETFCYYDYMKQIQTVVIGEGVQSIGSAFFYGCENLTSVTLPSSLVAIGNSAFLNCARLTAINIPDGLQVIGSWAFQNCVSLGSITVPDSVLAIGPYAFSYCASLTDVTLPDHLPEILEGTFWYCISLENITLPEQLALLHLAAFSECTALTDITIPAGVLGIDVLAFGGCTSLRTITFEGDAPQLIDGAFSGVTADVRYPGGNATWTDDIKQNYGGLLTWLPTGGSCAHGETSITGQVDSTCTETGYSGDTVCQLCGITLRRGVLVPITGHSLKDGACTHCEAKIDGSTGVCGDGLIWVLDKSGTLTISGTGYMYDYYEDQPAPYLEQADKIKKIVLKDGVTYIGSMAFFLCQEVTQVTIPDGVVYIGEGAFAGCTKLTSVTIPGSVDTIGGSAFQECYELKTLKVGEGVTTIDAYAFANCLALSDVTLPNSVTAIAEGAFQNCEALSAITLPQELTIIGPVAFANCTGLTSITIPDTVTVIGEEAFRESYNIKEIIFTGDAPAIYENAFSYIIAEAYYPETNPSWTEEVRQDYGGTLTWIFKCIHRYEEGICTNCGKVDPDWALPEGVTRLAGAHRYETAFLTANQMKVNLGIEKFDTVVVASGTDFADALSGSYLASVKQAPILLACKVDWVNEEVRDYIKDNLKEGGTVYILGGTSAIPDSFQTGLEAFNVVRLAGGNRFETNLKVLEEAGVGDKPILVCTGLGFADSLSASATQQPILLVYGSKLTKDQESFLEAHKDRQFYVIGGTSAVRESLATQLKDYGAVERVAGKDRFETSVKIASMSFGIAQRIVFAYAWDFPDGLCGGPLATTMDAALILLMEGYEDAAADYIGTLDGSIVLGGEKLVPNASINKLIGIE